MKTAGRGSPNRWAKHVQQPSTWCGRSKQILLIQVGCEARKIPAVAEIFFLTSAFIEQGRTYLGTLFAGLMLAIACFPIRGSVVVFGRDKSLDGEQFQLIGSLTADEQDPRLRTHAPECHF